MVTTLVVDGYNAIYAIPALKKEMAKSLKDARTAVLAAAKRYARSSGFITSVRVVFDGDDRFQDLNSFELSADKAQSFSKTGEGDKAVIDMVKRCTKYGRVIIASDDNYVRNNSRVYGAHPINVRELTLQARGKKKASKKTLTKRIDKCLEERITREYKKELGYAE